MRNSMRLDYSLDTDFSEISSDAAPDVQQQH